MSKLPEIKDINAQYEENAALLLERIAKRDEVKELLKIAAPDKIVDVRNAIARYNKIFEDTE